MARAALAPAWFRSLESAAGALTLVAVHAALAMANSPLRGLYEYVHHTPVALRVGVLAPSLASAALGTALILAPGRRWSKAR